MSGSGDTTLPFYHPDPKLFFHFSKNKIGAKLKYEKSGYENIFFVVHGFYVH